MAELNWDDLRFFLTLARENRLSAAGRVLGVKHTTVARRINALEAQLGARLFDHSADGYNMNQAGENLYEHALVMEEQALAVNREIIGMDAQLAGPLKLTAPANLMSLMVVPAIHRLQQAYPGIEVELIGTTGLLDLAARQADRRTLPCGLRRRPRTTSLVAKSSPCSTAFTPARSISDSRRIGTASFSGMATRTPPPGWSSTSRTPCSR